MSQKIKYRISMDANGARPKTKHYTHHSDGYGQHNGEFCFSSDIEKWMHGKAHATKKAPNLF